MVATRDEPIVTNNQPINWHMLISATVCRRLPVPCSVAMFYGIAIKQNL